MPIGSPCSVKGCANFAEARSLCNKHYQNWRYHHSDEVVKRPHDWGAREKHELYDRWNSRRRLEELSVEWAADFWEFVKDVGPLPSKNHNLVQLDKSKRLGPNNWAWRKMEIRGAAKDNDARAKYMREYRVRNPRIFKDLDLKKKFSVGIDWFEQKFQEQNGICAICGKPETAVHGKTGKVFQLAVDHCHDTKEVRGLLCHQCNRGIGQLRHDIPTLQAAIEYLKQFEKEQK